MRVLKRHSGVGIVVVVVLVLAVSRMLVLKSAVREPFLVQKAVSFDGEKAAECAENSCHESESAILERNSRAAMGLSPLRKSNRNPALSLPGRIANELKKDLRGMSFRDFPDIWLFKAEFDNGSLSRAKFHLNQFLRRAIPPHARYIASNIRLAVGCVEWLRMSDEFRERKLLEALGTPKNEIENYRKRYRLHSGVGLVSRASDTSKLIPVKEIEDIILEDVRNALSSDNALVIWLREVETRDLQRCLVARCFGKKKENEKEPGSISFHVTADTSYYSTIKATAASGGYGSNHSERTTWFRDFFEIRHSERLPGCIGYGRFDPLRSSLVCAVHEGNPDSFTSNGFVVEEAMVEYLLCNPEEKPASYLQKPSGPRQAFANRLNRKFTNHGKR